MDQQWFSPERHAALARRKANFQNLQFLCLGLVAGIPASGLPWMWALLAAAVGGLMAIGSYGAGEDIIEERRKPLRMIAR